MEQVSQNQPAKPVDGLAIGCLSIHGCLAVICIPMVGMHFVVSACDWLIGSASVLKSNLQPSLIAQLSTIVCFFAALLLSRKVRSPLSFWLAGAALALSCYCIWLHGVRANPEQPAQWVILVLQTAVLIRFMLHSANLRYYRVTSTSA